MSEVQEANILNVIHHS